MKSEAELSTREAVEMAIDRSKEEGTWGELLRERVTFRATVMGVEGADNRVLLLCQGGACQFSLRATPEIASKARLLLREPATVTAKLERAMRAPDCPVVDGWVDSMEGLTDAEPTEAIDSWYRAIGRPLLNETPYEVTIDCARCGHCSGAR